MKKTKLTRSLLAACSIVALSAVMYGCVHSGDNGADTGGDTGVEEPMQTPAEQLAAANTAVENAEAAVAAATNATERAAAYAQLAAAEQMLADAESIPENVLAALRQRLGEAEDDLDAAEDLRTAIDAANAAQMAAGALDDDSDQAAVTAAMGLVTAAQTAVDALGADDMARLQGQLDSVSAMVTAAQTGLDNAAAVAAATKAAGTKEMAIAAEAAQTTDAGLGGSDVTTHSMTISRDRDGTTVKIEDSALAGDDDPKFMQAMDLGGGRTMHTRTMEADDDGNVESEVVIVSTDIEAPTGVKFADWEDAEGDTPHDISIRQDGEAVDTDNPADSMTVAAGSDNVNLPLIMSASFPAAGGGSSSATHSFLPAADDADPDTDGDQPRDAAMVDGTYRGAMGTYTCSGNANCTVTVNDEGEITGIGQGWIFTPDEGATSDQPDYDYLHYGFWLKRTMDAMGATEYDEVETFADASSDSSNVSDVTGKATYSGGATGVYVHAVTNSDGTRASATSGHFTADASLTAYFGQTVNDTTTTDADEAGQIAPTNLNSISGTIDDFALSGHDTGPGWSVSLEKASITSDPTDAPHASGVAKGGGADGSYFATFHGATPDTESTGDGNNQVAPGTVVGEFNASFSNGSVAGAFGADKD